ncbi:histone acetylation protein-domain-containing protein [Dichotomopilus funicola]|uniref:histone acetyltransferase n=1 Tax=Dichotomopilus funicola TaxID=1934379 RepID=A0AAN6UV12_9PEZI|nr:histone acetylation protein-domain-containing protein [Dichotomopilus funicola]
MLSPTPPAPNPKCGIASDTGSTSNSSLRDKLAAVLPRGHKFGIHHVSTPPARTEPLCMAPPGQRPDKTYRESHFLAVSIHPQNDNNNTNNNKAVAQLKRASPGADCSKGEEGPKSRALVFAVEVLIFTTAYQTTLFVSKADSTGYLHLLGLPPGAPPPIRQVLATFLAYLLDHRRRNHVQSVVNLFARAQAQYLFPGSVRNKGKHVLDDWGLVRWWCRVLNPLIEESTKRSSTSSRGYLLVPGLEESEMRAFLPRTPGSMANWTIGHPLERISHYSRDSDSVPPRCLIPGYPDDPKSRFRDELDEEVSSKKQGVEAWKSVKSLGQFWEMMAFRQECSSGRLTGFIWLVFDTTPRTPLATPNPSVDSPLQRTPATLSRQRAGVSSTTSRPSSRKPGVSPVALPSVAPPQNTKKKSKKKLSGPIIPRTPKIKTHATSRLINRPKTTAYYYWPTEGRGDQIVDDTEYKRIVELLLHLDFSTLDKAIGSSRRWLHEIGAGSNVGEGIVGRAVFPQVPGVTGTAAQASSGTVTNLTGLVRRKNPAIPAETTPNQTPNSRTEGTSTPIIEPAAKVNVLGTNLVRKRKKVVEG